MAHAFAETLQSFKAGIGLGGKFYSLPALAAQFPNVRRLPVSMRIVLESVLRNCDGRKVTAEHVAQVANWQPNAERTEEIPFTVARVVLQDFTGVPLLADLAAMRSAAQRLGKDVNRIEPLVPVDLVVDHSIMVDYYGQKNAIDLNMKLEFQRNRERYQFMKWGMQAFDTFGVVPPGFGIVHQVNLEYLARGVHRGPDDVCYFDSLVGTDSHTTMINGVGVVGWGVGGIEGEAAMLGQPVYFLTPDVVGFELSGKLREGCTATDLVLTVTEILRRHKVVGKFVEFFGEGTRSLGVTDRATIGNMAPEYGATMGFFPVDERTIEYFEGTGRSKEEIKLLEAYFKAQGMFGVPMPGEVDYSQVIRLDLGTVTPSLSGPKRPQDRIEIGKVAETFRTLFSKPVAENGFNKAPELLQTRHLVHRPGVNLIEDRLPPDNPPVPADAPRFELEMQANKPTPPSAHTMSVPPVEVGDITIGNGDVLIAAITSCTNTSNPGVMLAAGLLAKKAVEKGLRVQPHIKTSLAPGSRMVTEYLRDAKLLPYLEQLGFTLAGYGCTTCIGNSGDLTSEINEAISQSDLVCAAVLSGNRNFEARIHPNIKANFLASPPLVVAYAIAGTMLKDLMTEPVGRNDKGQDVWLGDIWPSSDEVQKLMKYAMNAKGYRSNYAKVKSDPGELWKNIEGAAGETYDWPASTYIAEPPFFDGFTLEAPATSAAGGTAGAAQPHAIRDARIMALFGDSITTDHISPAGSIKDTSPAGRYLLENGVQKPDFNSYGSRRGNHEVMMRGTFANVRIKNLMLPAGPDGSRKEGGYTLYRGGDGQAQEMFIYDAAMKYIAEGRPTVVFAGEEYGTGSSRDWAAKGTQLLGIKAVVARSFERIHRSNLVGMGVLPLQFQGDMGWQSLGLTGEELVDIEVDPQLKPMSNAALIIRKPDGTSREVKLTLRIDTPIEVDYYRHGGILPYVLRQLLTQ
ncbi:aconitate hydratase [Ramlibacter sp. USB13]|uniref:Aconitate hydratase A n=1 Tax=Ramlibacter cellulosilyticus TaxID=2764187 RepID=A0A923S9U8_9BURK|nr:aconitate hydratase [Ramlibacter cellulosilyticus]MBC5782050.1 aconitate hydratase [Ramlibacter cellulosilyticus]